MVSTRQKWRFATLALLLLLLATSTATAQEQAQGRILGDKNNNRNNNSNNTPKERDVSGIPRMLCSTQALLDADISKNKFISRAEYVNLLLGLAPQECPIIDSWLNDTPLQSTFDELSCLCQKYGGVDGENNCCLQSVGVPMLASFAVPDSYYPAEYAAEACHIIDLVLHQECPMSFSPTDTPTNSPTLGPTLNPTTMEPSTSPTMNPTVAESEEETESGETINVIIEGGDVTVEEPPDKMEHYEGGVMDDDYHGLAHSEAVLVTVLEEQEEEEEPGPPLPQSQSNDEEVVQQEEEGEVQEEEEEESVVVVTTTESEEPEVDLKPSEPTTTLPPNTNANPDIPAWNDGGLILQQAPQNPAVHNQRQTPVGIVLAALLAVSLVMTLGLFALWGKRRREYKKQQQMEPTVISDGGDATTPTRSNASRSRSAWSSDGDDSSTEDDDDSDIERPRLASRAGGPVVVRAEFQDDLSIWGRRKRRKQERKQWREDRKSLSQQPQSYGSSMSNVLNTLEFEGNASDTVLILSNHDGAPECSPHSSLGGKCSTIHNPSTPKADIDIFDDTSDTSSYYDRSPEPTEPMPLETSIENWLEQVQNLSPSPANQSIHSQQMLDDQSTASRMSAASRMSRRSQHSTTSSKSRQASPFKRQSKPGAVLPPSSSRSFSPARSVHSTRSVPYSPHPQGPTILVPSSPPASQCFNILASSASFSPSSSPKRTSHSVPASPSSARVLLEASLLSSPRIAPSTSTPSSPQCRKMILTTNTAHLDLPVEHTHHTNRLSPDSQEFYDSVLRLEPSDEDDEHLNHASPFAFETARQRDSARYLV